MKAVEIRVEPSEVLPLVWEIGSQEIKLAADAANAVKKGFGTFLFDNHYEALMAIYMVGKLQGSREIKAKKRAG